MKHMVDNKYKKMIILLIICILLIIVLGFKLIEMSSSKIKIYNNPSTIDEEEDVLSNEENQIELHDDNKEIIVHIAGEVNNPGIVCIKEGQRLDDALKLVGGATEKANLDSINLAIKLYDEQKIYIPAIGETNEAFVEENPIEQIDDTRININTADKNTLMTLSGIGDTIATNIIEYREKYGGFKKPEDIKKVNRIGDKTYEKIKDFIRIK